MALILASSSPTRKTLLENAGLLVETIPARVDEEAFKDALLAEGADARDVADALAEAKARKVSLKHPDALILGADQTLGLRDTVLSKSPDRDAARATLQSLRGERHQLYSAAVIFREGKALWRHVAVARLQMRAFSDAYLDTYLDRNWPAVAGAVGAYHLEGEGIRLFSRVDGDYFTVLGLPLVEILSYLTLTGEIDA